MHLKPHYIINGCMFIYHAYIGTTSWPQSNIKSGKKVTEMFTEEPAVMDVGAQQVQWGGKSKANGFTFGELHNCYLLSLSIFFPFLNDSSRFFFCL